MRLMEAKLALAAALIAERDYGIPMTIPKRYGKVKPHSRKMQKALKKKNIIKGLRP